MRKSFFTAILGLCFGSGFLSSEVRAELPPVLVAKGVFNSASSFQEKSGIDEFLQKRGRVVLFADTPRGETLETRGEKLRAEIKRLVPSGPFHLVGVSMGGLDSRYALSHDPEIARRCLSLTTIASPHHGSPVAKAADWLLSWSLPSLHRIWAPTQERPLLIRLMEAATVLTPEFVQEKFNPSTPNAPGVRYASISTSISQEWLPFDGLVSRESAQWGEVLGTIEAHHMKAVFNTDPFDPKEPATQAWMLVNQQIERVESHSAPQTSSSSFSSP